MEGRLLRFYRVPPQLESEPRPRPPRRPTGRRSSPRRGSTRASFRAVGAALDAAVLRRHARRVGGDRGRAAPTSRSASRPPPTAGRPVWFEIVWPWTRPDRMEKYAWPTGKLLKQALFLTLSLLLLGAASFMARRNLVLGRGDRRGAFRVALLLAGAGILSWALGAHHVADWNAQIGLVSAGPGRSCSRPRSSGSSTSRSSRTRGACGPGRSSRGRASWAAASAIPWSAATPSWASRGPCWCSSWRRCVTSLPPLFGQPPPEPIVRLPRPAARPGRRSSARRSASASDAVLLSLGVLLLFVLARCVLRRDVLAAARSWLILLRRGRSARRRGPGSTLPVSVVWMVTWILLLLRFGLLAAIVGPSSTSCCTCSRSRPTCRPGRRGPRCWCCRSRLLAVLALRNALGGTGLRRYAGLAPLLASRAHRAP